MYTPQTTVLLYKMWFERCKLCRLVDVMGGKREHTPLLNICSWTLMGLRASKSALARARPPNFAYRMKSVWSVSGLLPRSTFWTALVPARTAKLTTLEALLFLNSDGKSVKILNAMSWNYGTFRLPWMHSSNAHAQPSSGARCPIFGRVYSRLLPYFMCVNSEGSSETERMRRFAWAFAGRLCNKYHNLCPPPAPTPTILSIPRFPPPNIENLPTPVITLSTFEPRHETTCLRGFATR